MALVDATGLRLVPWLGGFALDASDLRKVNSPRPSLVDRMIIEAHFAPGGPGGPMRENPYRDWPPAREGWR